LVRKRAKEIRPLVVNIKLDKVEHINYTKVRKGSSPVFPQVSQYINHIIKDGKWSFAKILHRSSARDLRRIKCKTNNTFKTRPIYYITNFSLQTHLNLAHFYKKASHKKQTQKTKKNLQTENPHTCGGGGAGASGSPGALAPDPSGALATASRTSASAWVEGRASLRGREEPALSSLTFFLSTSCKTTDWKDSKVATQHAKG
jgi:hypothetical protein